MTKIEPGIWVLARYPVGKHGAVQEVFGKVAEVFEDDDDEGEGWSLGFAVRLVVGPLGEVWEAPISDCLFGDEAVAAAGERAP